MKKEPDYNLDNKVVVRNDYVYASHPAKMSIYGMKLLRIAIAQCRKRDSEFYEYEFSVSDLADMIGCDRSNLYRVADEVTDQLLRVLIKTAKLEDKRSRGKKYPVFFKCSYENGIITLQLHPETEELFLNLRRNFTSIPLGSLLLLQSKYGIRLFELICQKMMHNYPYAGNSIEIFVSLEEIRIVTGTVEHKAYDKISNLKSKILVPSLKDIEKAALWKIICIDRKHGRRIVGFDLQIWTEVGYNYIEKCKATGKIPTFNDEIPGQLSLFDLRY